MFQSSLMNFHFYMELSFTNRRCFLVGYPTQLFLKSKLIEIEQINELHQFICLPKNMIIEIQELTKIGKIN